MTTDDEPLAQGEEGEGAGATPTSFKPKTKQVVIAVAVTVGILLLVFGVMLPSIVSYEDIWAAIQDMEPWHFAVLLGIWLVKVPFDGVIYSRSLPGLKVQQGSMAWAASTSFSNVVPGPGDLLVRLSMYRTWGHQVDQSMISMTTSGIFQNVNRLSLPVIGVIWYAASTSEDVAGWLIVLALVGLAVLVAGVLFGVMVIRSESFARKVGGWIERLVGWAATKFKRDAPDDVVGTLIEWRDSAKGLIRERWWQLWLAHFTTTVLNIVMLTAALRFAGVTSENLTPAEIFLSYALVQLVTLIPITNGNIGIAEMAYILFLDAFASGGDAVTGAIAAGVIIFRIYNWLLVIPVGFTATAVWRSKWKKRLGYDPFTILLKKQEDAAVAGG
jgi:uncharacterized membrane protein YbhN (UPF0104 family)